MYKKILVPTDGSPLSKKAMKSAVELASTLGAEMVADLGLDQVADLFAQELDLALERSVAIIGLKPRLHLLVRQPLQLSSLGTHSTALRHSHWCSAKLMTHEWLRGS